MGPPNEVPEDNDAGGEDAVRNVGRAGDVDQTDQSDEGGGGDENVGRGADEDSVGGPASESESMDLGALSDDVRSVRVRRV